jgi:hypothetical protein
MKSEINEIAATMAFSATQNNDKIGLIVFRPNRIVYSAKKRKITCIKYYSRID